MHPAPVGPPSAGAMPGPVSSNGGQEGYFDQFFEAQKQIEAVNAQVKAEQEVAVEGDSRGWEGRSEVHGEDTLVQDGAVPDVGEFDEAVEEEDEMDEGKARLPGTNNRAKSLSNSMTSKGRPTLLRPDSDPSKWRKLKGIQEV